MVVIFKYIFVFFQCVVILISLFIGFILAMFLTTSHKGGKLPVCWSTLHLKLLSTVMNGFKSPRVSC